MSTLDLTTLKAYALAQAEAVCFDLTQRSHVRFVGKDRASFLNNFCTNDLVRCPVGSGCEAFLLTNQAKIMAWLQISVLPDQLHVDLEPDLATKVVTYLSRYIVTEDVEINDATAEIGMWHIAGPQAATRLSSWLGTELAGWSDWHHDILEVAGTHIRLQKRAWLGPNGYHLFGPKQHAARIVDALWEQQIPMAPAETYSILRVEAGLPEYGIDIDETHLPQEVNRTEQAISFTKGCYLGQETVARIRAYGHVNRALVRCVTLPGTPQLEPLPKGTKLLANGQEVGQVTSCCWSPRHQGLLAFAYVRRGFNASGQLLTAHSQNQTIALQLLS